MTQGTETVPAGPLPSPKERRRLREANSLSQEQVATALGVTRRTIKAWESGRSNPKGHKRAAYAQLLASFGDASSADAPSTAPPSTVPGGDASGRSPQGVERNTPEQNQVPERSTPEETPRGGTDPKAPAKDDHHTTPHHPAPAPAPPPDGRSPAQPHEAREAPRAERRERGVQEQPPRRGTDPKAPAKTPAPDPPSSEPPEEPTTAQAAFDALYTHAAPTLLGQTYLLTGSRDLARESVEYAFRLTWQRWPEVARDRDPASWVRAAAYEYAISPWHRLRRAHKRPDRPLVDRDRRVLLEAMLALPPAYRRTLLLYDGLGLDLPDTAAETEASTPAAASRVLNARAAVTQRLPELRTAETPAEQCALLQERLRTFAETGPAPPIKLPPAHAVRTGSERKTRFWTRAAIFFTALIVTATGFTVATAPTRYAPPHSPGKPIGGVPVRAGPPALSPQEEELRERLFDEPISGPPRLIPDIR